MTEQNFGLLDKPEDIKTYVRRILAEGKPFGFDIEGGYTGPNKAGLSLQHFHPNWKMVGFSFTNDETWARYIPIGHDNGQNAPDVPTARLIWVLLQSGLGVAHNASYELQGLARWFRDVLWDDPILGAQVQLSDGYFPVFSDTMIEAFMLQRFEPRRVGIGLKGLQKHLFGYEQRELKTFFQGRAAMNTLRFNILDLTPEVVAYACDDAVRCLMLHNMHYEEVKDMLMFKTEILLLPILARMEKEGLALDWDEYARRRDEIASFKEKMNEAIQKELETRLNRPVSVLLSSPVQVAKVLYSEPPEGLGLPIKEYTDKGQPSTGESALRAIAKKDPVIKQILQWREVGKLLSSYIVKYLEELRYADDDRAHPNHKQTGAATGRFSVDHVSYQQWPKPYKYELDDGTTLKLNYRDFLIAPPGFRIVGYDFSQVELRVLAGMADETSLLQAFADGIDIHVATASLMMGIPVEEITKKQRAVGKTLNFAIVYGSGAANIAELLGIEVEEAEEYLRKYFEAFPKLKGWMDDRVTEGKENGYVFTKFGRKFKIWEYEEQQSWIQAKGDRMCVNAPVQGGAADYMKLGMVRVDKTIRRAEEEGRIPRGSIRLVMTVHDALEFYVRDDVDTQTVIDLINPAVSFPVPGLPEIKADWHEGRKWGSVVEIDLDKNKQITGYGYEDEDGNKHHFDTLQEAYDHMDNPPVIEKPEIGEPDPEVEAALAEIEDADLEPLAKSWAPEIKDALNEGEPGTWSHCGNDKPHSDHKHTVVMNEGPHPDIQCLGTPYPEEPEWVAKPARLKNDIWIRLTDLPNANEWSAVKAYLAERRGDQLVHVETPQGQKTLDGTYDLREQDLRNLEHLLSGLLVNDRIGA